MNTIDDRSAPVTVGAPPLVRSALLERMPWLRHGITTRVAGLGVAEGNVGYTAPRDQDDAWRMRRLWTEAVGLDPDRIVRVHQVHGPTVAVATDTDGRRGGRPESTGSPVADAIVTDTPGLALMTLHADCLPVLLADRRRRVVAAVHAGWRGTLADVAGATVRTMSTTFGTDPDDVSAFIGPGIGVEHYEVGEEVAATFARSWPAADVVRLRDGRPHVDLKRANAWQLELAGVARERIDTSPLCTVSDADRLFSHRAQGAGTGRFAAIIGNAGGGA